MLHNRITLPTILNWNCDISDRWRSLLPWKCLNQQMSRHLVSGETSETTRAVVAVRKEALLHTDIDIYYNLEKLQKYIQNDYCTTLWWWSRLSSRKLVGSLWSLGFAIVLLDPLQLKVIMSVLFFIYLFIYPNDSSGMWLVWFKAWNL